MNQIYILFGLLVYGIPLQTSATINNTTWTVSKKTCDAKSLPLFHGEKVSFDVSTFTYFLRQIKEETTKDGKTNKTICVEQQSYFRKVMQATSLANSHTEDSELYPQDMRVTCFDSQNAISSDVIKVLTGEKRLLSLVLGTAKGIVNIYGTDICTQGVLRLELIKE